MLVRAGLADRAQIQRIHRVLDKMKEDKPVLTASDRSIVTGKQIGRAHV